MQCITKREWVERAVAMCLELTTTGAFLAGLLSFASPCVLPLLPPYLVFIGGVPDDKQ
jgi:cytochrome c biogenesis protein CcdA